MCKSKQKLYIYYGRYRTANEHWKRYKHHKSVSYSAYKCRLLSGWSIWNALRNPIKVKGNKV